LISKGVSNPELAELLALRKRTTDFLWLDIPGWSDDAEASLANEFQCHPVIRFDDGRRLGFVEYGEPSGPALLYFHGHPGSCLEARFLADAARRADLRLIGLDRPGLGLSDDQSRRQLSDWSADIVQVIDRLGLERVAIIGYSAGASYALDRRSAPSAAVPGTRFPALAGA
jgi:pimeloyl-ACP methyl ester carboxylesterase